MSILQLRIELADVAPLIWRRLQIPDTYSFWDLHVAIQSAFGWNDSHLHEFAVPGKGGNAALLHFGIPLPDDGFQRSEDRPLAGWEHRVSTHLALGLTGVTYLYDFGDHWEHSVVLEQILESSPGRRYPRCVAGERAGPPDDCGGPHGYASLLEVLADPKAENHAEMRAWTSSIKGLRGAFDPEAFDEQQIKFANPMPRLRRMLREIG
ncbi:MAG TPA: plasmid pRiA4b ORF-3 family protein [Vicinamibacterales bacterium]|nr:plasmid pRiA4b ORF-3 family protein [Vicinamibacterales bacterium]